MPEEASSQRPRPGHEGRGHAIFPHRPEGGRPGPWALPPPLGRGAFEPESSAAPLLPSLAGAASPQPDLHGAGVRALLGGWAPAGAPAALRRSDVDGHHVPDVQDVLGLPEAVPHEALGPAREIQPQEGVEGGLAAEAPPGLGHYGPLDSGVVQVGRQREVGPALHPALPVHRDDLALDRAPAVGGGPGPQVAVSPSGAWQRGLGRAQVSAQVSAQVAAHVGGAAASGPRRAKHGFRKGSECLRTRNTTGWGDR